MMNELDELRLKIAKAKGWKLWAFSDQRRKAHYCEPPGVMPEPMTYGYPMHEISTTNSIYAFSHDAPDWPHDIAAAWELVEEVRSNHCWVIVDSDSVAGGWDCGIQSIGEFDGEKLIAEYCASGSTAPEAICWAWLAWKEAQNE